MPDFTFIHSIISRRYVIMSRRAVNEEPHAVLPRMAKTYFGRIGSKLSHGTKIVILAICMKNLRRIISC